MYIFFSEYFFTLAIFILYGLVGGFAVVPLQRNIKYAAMAAPMAGMLLLSMGVFMLYTFAHLSIIHSMIIVGSIGASLTLACIAYSKPSINLRTILFLSSVIIVLAAFLTFFLNSTSIKLGGIGLLYVDGSDHLGYAAMSDWLKSNLINHLPIENAAHPYQSFPALLVGMDQRFGCFFNLAIIATLFGESSAFSYDIACTIILLTAYLGCAAMFARSSKTFILLVLALTVSTWFVLSRTGYLGKIMGFSSMLYTLGLFYSQQQSHLSFDKNNISIITIVLLVFAAAMVYPGMVLALFLMASGGIYLLIKSFELLRHFDKHKLTNLLHDTGLLLIMILAALAAMGALALPKLYAAEGVNYPADWARIFLFQLDIRAMIYEPVLSWFTQDVVMQFLIAAMLIMTVLLIIASICRSIVAVSLIGVAVALSAFGYFLSLKWFSYELSGTLYALSICGCIWCIDEVSIRQQHIISGKILSFILFSLAIAAIAIRIPSNIEAIHRYVFNTPTLFQYSKNDMDKLAETIGHDAVIVDVPSVMFALPILAEFGRRDLKLQWTSETWKNILGYRSWSAPKIMPSRFVLRVNPDVMALLSLQAEPLQHCDLVAETVQYQLFDCQKSTINQISFTHQKI